MKKKLLIFHSALAPYRVDFFNMFNKIFDSKVVFLSRNNRNQNFDNKKLFSKTQFKYDFLDKKIVFRGRDFNLGYLSKIKSEKPDIIIGGEYGLPTILPYLFRFFSKKKYKIFTICDDSIDIAKNCVGLRKYLRNYLVVRLDGIIVLSNEIANWYSNQFKLKNPPIVFPLIRDENQYRKELQQSVEYSKQYIEQFKLKNKKIYLYIGRLDIVKNLELMLTSFDEIAKNEDILILVGDGPQASDLKSKANQLKTKSQILFPGRYENEKLMAWYQLGDCFILPSIYEPFGAVINEALVSGCPVICSKYAGSSTLVSETNGILFDPKLPGDLKMAFRKFNELFPINKQKNNEELKENLMNVKFEECSKNLFKQILKYV